MTDDETTADGPRRLPGATPRVETGPVKFGDDWTGAFIREDSAMWFAHNLARAIPEVSNAATRLALGALLDAISGCREAAQP